MSEDDWRREMMMEDYSKEQLVERVLELEKDLEVVKAINSKELNRRMGEVLAGSSQNAKKIKDVIEDLPDDEVFYLHAYAFGYKIFGTELIEATEEELRRRGFKDEEVKENEEKIKAELERIRDHGLPDEIEPSEL